MKHDTHRKYTDGLLTLHRGENQTLLMKRLNAVRNEQFTVDDNQFQTLITRSTKTFCVYEITRNSHFFVLVLQSTGFDRNGAFKTSICSVHYQE